MVTKEMMRNSMEGCWRKHQVKLSLVILMVLLILVMLFSKNGDIMKDFGKMITLGIVFGLLILYQLIQYFLLFVDYQHYDVYEVTLEQATTSLVYRRAVYYTVCFRTKNGEFINCDTKALWSDSIGSLFCVAKYGNVKVKIAYNADKNKLVVLGR